MTTKKKLAHKDGDTVKLSEEHALVLRDRGFRPRMMDTVQRIADAAQNRAWDEAAKKFGFANTLQMAEAGFAMRTGYGYEVVLVPLVKETPND